MKFIDEICHNCLVVLLIGFRKLPSEFEPQSVPVGSFVSIYLNNNYWTSRYSTNDIRVLTPLISELAAAQNFSPIEISGN